MICNETPVLIGRVVFKANDRATVVWLVVVPNHIVNYTEALDGTYRVTSLKLSIIVENLWWVLARVFSMAYFVDSPDHYRSTTKWTPKPRQGRCLLLSFCVVITISSTVEQSTTNQSFVRCCYLLGSGGRYQLSEAHIWRLAVSLACPFRCHYSTGLWKSYNVLS